MDLVVCTTAYLGPPNREPRNLLNAPLTNPAGLGHKDPPKTKKTKNQSFTENAGTVLVFLIFGFLEFCFFGFLDFWFLHSENKKPKIKKNKKPKIQKTKTVPAFSVKLWFFGFLVLALVSLWTDEIRAQTRYLWKSTMSPVGAVF